MRPEKLLICLQFWDGDRADALRLARFMADLEPTFNHKVHIMFCARFDAVHDSETLNYVSKKFEVSKYTSVRKGATGWPYGCNELVHSVWHELLVRSRQDPKFLQTFSAGYFLEADNVPLRRDWLKAIMEEWETREPHEVIMGAWHPSCSPVGHINGNMLFVPDLAGRISGLEGCAPNVGWDAAHVHRFSGRWKASQLMKNWYHATKVSVDALFCPDIPGGPAPAVVHGVKDDSAWKIVQGLVRSPV